MESYEKLGFFYLGKVFDPHSQRRTDEYLLYDARDLVTHAVCVGMTGSGKTGLCLGLLEEAAIDRVPAIIIDPKGDLGNLLLTFPDLRPEDFRPWINEDEALKKGLTPESYALEQAASWEKGLAEWEQTRQRISNLKNAADFAIYTPGSSAGLPLSVLRSFAAPAPGVRADGDLLRERILTTTSGLLGLLGLEADPLRSREHILVSNILERSWLSGKDVDLPALIQMIQSPPLQRVGVFELDAFYPPPERLKFAMTLNNLLAAPGFDAWMEGEPLEVDRLLYTQDGRPRLSVFCISHLSDAERMFFVTLLLNQVLGWMRTQSGTTSLRALLYMDEVFGFLPPVAEPPSKRTLLTLLKQARAFGLGVVLATQNPVDLDYKGLSNAGTWFIGRLQTERDKDRLLEGLSGAATGSGTALDPAVLSDLLSRLGKRVFLMHNVHEDRPVLFQTRWTLSYLRGPLTRAQIKQLMDARRSASEPVARGMQPIPPLPPAAPAPATAAFRPQLPPSVNQFFVPPGRAPETAEIVYRPCAFAAGKVHLIDNRLGLSQAPSVLHYFAFDADTVNFLWDDAAQLPLRFELLERQPLPQAGFLPPPAQMLQVISGAGLERTYRDYLQRACELRLWKSNLFKLVSQPGESERDFRVRLSQMARERRDFELESLRRRYAGKFEVLNRQEAEARLNLERQQQEYSQQTMQTAISVGGTLLGALFGGSRGRYGSIGRATTAARSAGRASREYQDIDRARARLEEAHLRKAQLELQLREEADRLAAGLDPLQETLQEIVVRPKKTDILVLATGLLWVPYCQGRALTEVGA
jgi:hypothetical protein